MPRDECVESPSANASLVGLARSDRDVLRPEYDCAGWTDHELVFAAASVRDAAFAELFHRHSTSVAAVARMVLGPNSCGDDIVSEVFTALWCAPEKFEPDRGSLLGFLRMQARSRSIDLLRNESSRYRREQNDELGLKLCTDIEADVIAAEVGAELRRAVSRLPEGERAAIELAYFVGMSYQAVASRLDLPEGTVKSRIRSGIRRLRTQDFEIGPDVHASPAQDRKSAPRRPSRDGVQ